MAEVSRRRRVWASVFLLLSLVFFVTAVARRETRRNNAIHQAASDLLAGAEARSSAAMTIADAHDWLQGRGFTLAPKDGASEAVTYTPEGTILKRDQVIDGYRLLGQESFLHAQSWITISYTFDDQGKFVKIDQHEGTGPAPECVEVAKMFR